ncbi:MULTISPECIES: right-handed parallel beta-helix repeat-containing protein [unclassified Saccharicrinis]|uniref:right-handed parallel beta-helix repeat-containing protein n=1 Tax=unclassified Saccharicrinis TaxID=2646859 RepID=UPI003D33B4A4
MLHNIKKYLLVLLLILPIFANAEDYNITGYFTHVYAREHVTDMPRAFFMLIEADGTITPMYFHRYSSKNTGDLGKWKFDPRDYLGKTVSMDFEGTPENNNNEYPIYEGENLVLIPKVSVEIINSLTVVASDITVDEQYQYPQTDTLLIPHDVLIAEEHYSDKNPTEVVKLTDYVQGNGTEASPYTSPDGFAGLKAAIADLPNGGTIEAVSGVYKATSKNLTIPRFVSIKGVGETKPYFILANERMWYLKGSNTLDFIDVDVTQINRTYTHEVISIHNNARDVTIKNSKFIGNYAVDPVTYKESGNVVMFRMYSHLNNITFEADTIIAPLRGIVCKGQRNQHNITIKDCVFKDQAQMSISFDQSSNISNVVLENNKFLEFSHFGVAFARINDVTIRNNTFYSQNKLAFNTYNQALHIEEHCQNFVIENNDIDVELRTAGYDNDPNTKERSPGILVTDSRQFTVNNNRLKNADIVFIGVQSRLIGHSNIFDNTVDNGGFKLRESVSNMTISNNEISNSPEYAFYLYSTIPMAYPFGEHKIESNTITALEDAQAFYLNGQIKGLSVTNNTFRGCSQNSSSLNISDNSQNISFEGNTFFGRTASNTFSVNGVLPSGISLSTIKSGNKYFADCTDTSIGLGNRHDYAGIFPNPIKAGELLSFNNSAQITQYEIFRLNGTSIAKGEGVNLDTSNLKPSVYLIQLKNGNSISAYKLVVQ